MQAGGYRSGSSGLTFHRCFGPGADGFASRRLRLAAGLRAKSAGAAQAQNEGSREEEYFFHVDGIEWIKVLSGNRRKFGTCRAAIGSAEGCCKDEGKGVGPRVLQALGTC